MREFHIHTRDSIENRGKISLSVVRAAIVLFDQEVNEANKMLNAPYSYIYLACAAAVEVKREKINFSFAHWT